LIRGASASITDDDGVPAIVYAAKYNNASMVRLLLDRGAGVTGKDTLGNMAIHWAAQQGSMDVLPILIEAQSPIDPTNRDGMTPLMMAARGGQTSAARLLLAKGADPRKQDFTGRDALGWASQPVVRRLLEEKTR
jgi:ankyrin repeat protein